MSNHLLLDRYSEQITQLALGLEPLDALLDRRIGHRVDIALDGDPLPLPAWLRRQRGLAAGADVLRRLVRHASCRYLLLYTEGMKSQIRVRIDDPRRRFVPRRLQYDVPADIATASPRVFRPVLYPGAAYGLGANTTGLRGRVRWQGPTNRPVRWARVQAHRDGVPVATAHGDDRGEFLLVVPPAASAGLAELPHPVEITLHVTVFARAQPAPADPAQPGRDPLWDLEIEHVALPGPDTVSSGDQPPADYTQSQAKDVTFPLGELISLGEGEEFVLA